MHCTFVAELARVL